MMRAMIFKVPKKSTEKSNMYDWIADPVILPLAGSIRPGQNKVRQIERKKDGNDYCKF